jgi:WD40 repeat protein
MTPPGLKRAELALSAGGRTLLVSDPEQSLVQFWDTKTGRLINKLAGDGYDLYYPLFSRDGKYLLGISGKNRVVVWEVSPGGASRPPEPRPDAKPVVAEVKVRPGPAVKSPVGRLDHLAVSADGRRALSSNPDNVCIWSLEKEPKPLRTVKSKGAIGLALTPDGKFALTSHTDRSLRLWDLQAEKPPRSIGETPFPVMYPSLSPKGDRAILGGSGNGQVWIWDVAAGKEVQAIVAGLGAVVTVFLPDGKHALTGVGRTLTFWDVASGKEGRFLTGSGRRMDALVVSADGKRAVTGGNDGEVLLWDLEGGKGPWRLEGLPGTDLGVSVALSPDGRLVAACTVEGGPGPGHLRFWDAASGKVVGKFDGADYFLRDIAFASNIRLVARGKQDTVETLQLVIRAATGAGEGR